MATLYKIGGLKLRKESWSVSRWNCKSEDLCSVAPLGVLIAVVSNEFNNELGNAKGTLKIYNNSCNLVTSVKWYVTTDHMLAMQWTDDLQLISVFTNGCIRVYSAHGERLRTFYLHTFGSETKNRLDPSLVILRCWGNGLIYANLAAQSLYIQKGFDTPSDFVLELQDFSLSILDLGIIPFPDWDDTIVLFATINGLYYIKMDELLNCKDFLKFEALLTQINPCSYNKIVTLNYYTSPLLEKSHRTESSLVSPARVHLRANDTVADQNAPFSDEMIFSSFSEVKRAVGSDDTSYRVRQPPSYIALSNDSIISSIVYDGGFRILWELEYKSDDICIIGEGLVGVVDEGKITILDGLNEVSFPNKSLCIANEIGGGIRVLNSTSIDFINILSDDLDALSSLERCDVAYTLVKNYELFKNGDNKSSEVLYSIKDDLVNAANTCIEAAKHEWDYDRALLLVECATFSKSINSIYSNNHCVVIAYLRIVIGIKEIIKTNISQLISLGINRLLVILTSLRHYLLAIKISEFLGVKPNNTIIGWIKTRVKLGSHLTDAELFNIITSRLNNYRGIIPYSEIAETVYNEGREVLSLSLLEEERCSVRQFKLLCKWNKLSKAATIATNAGDPELVNYVILESFKNDLSNIITLSRDFKLLRNLFIKQCKILNNNRQLQLFYERTDDIFNAGLNAIHQSVEDDNYRSWLSFANGFFGSLSHKATDDNHTFWHESINYQIKLLDIQAVLEKDHNLNGFVGKSLMDTIFQLYKLGMVKEIQDLIYTFNLTSNQLKGCKIAAYYESHNVNELVTLALDDKNITETITEALLSIGATSATEQIINTLKPQHAHWLNRIKR